MPPTLIFLDNSFIAFTPLAVSSSLVPVLNVISNNLESLLVTLLSKFCGSISKGIVVPVMSLMLTTSLTHSISLISFSKAINSSSLTSLSTKDTENAPILKSSFKIF